MNKLKSLLTFDEKNRIIGIILAAVALVAGWWRINWYTGIIFAILFVGVGCFKLKKLPRIARFMLNYVWSIALVSITFCITVSMLCSGNLHQVGPYKTFLNLLCVYMLVNVVFAFTARWKLSNVVTTFALAFLCMANGFIYQFRGKELGPMDFASIGTAFNVAGQYELNLTSGMVFSWLLWGIAAFAHTFIPKLPKLPNKRARLTSLTLAIVYFMIIWVGTINVPIKMWETQGTEKNGYFLNFFMGVRDSFINEPDNYGPHTIQVYENEYEPVNIKSEDLPNIIIIMDESFADFRVIGNKEITSNIPITPFMDSLRENTIRGYALASVYGANTANSEFEVLTGHSMAFLPENSVPYQQHIGGEIYTLAWLLNYYGYKSIATHPYYADGWSRDTLYPKMGFSESTFIDSYPGFNMLRKYVSDREMFEYVMNKFQTKEKDKPMFLFGVTMQNHGGYTYEGENYIQTVELEGYSREYPKAEQYFSVIKETDSAVEYLLTELENYPEDTIVLFFGDHFPKIETEFYDELHGGPFETLDQQMLKYKVPFFIWANYDIPEDTVECTSLNFLSSRLLEVAGIEMPSYHSFLSSLERVIPAMNAMGYYSISKNGFAKYSEATGIEAEWINRYENLQYNDLFDEENRSNEFYGKYIGWDKTPNLGAPNIWTQLVPEGFPE